MSYTNRKEYQQKYRREHRQELDAYIKGWRAERKLKREVARQIEQKPVAPAPIG